MAERELRPSLNTDLGESFFDQAPGICVHCGKTAEKAGNYMRYIDLVGDIVFWATQGGVWVDRSSRVAAKCSKTRQRSFGRAFGSRGPSVVPWNRGAVGLESVT